MIPSRRFLYNSNGHFSTLGLCNTGVCLFPWFWNLQIQKISPLWPWDLEKFRYHLTLSFIPGVTFYVWEYVANDIDCGTWKNFKLCCIERLFGTCKNYKLFYKGTLGFENRQSSIPSIINWTWKLESDIYVGASDDTRPRRPFNRCESPTSSPLGASTELSEVLTPSGRLCAMPIS